jgi:hypothetical protein
VEVNIRGDDKEQLYLESARKRLDGLAAGEKKDAQLAFRLVKAGPEKKVTVLVSLSNREFSVFFVDTLKLQAGKPFMARDVRVPPDLEAAKAPPLKTSASRVTLEIRASDDEAVKDVYAYLGDKKLQYARNRGGAGPFPVRLDVPLEAGSNRLVVVARDQKNMVTSRTYFIYRSEGADETPRAGIP